MKSIFAVLLLVTAANAALTYNLDTSVASSVNGDILKKLFGYVKKIPQKYKIACRELATAKAGWEALSNEFGVKKIGVGLLGKFDKAVFYEIANGSSATITVDGNVWDNSNATVTLADAVQNLWDTYWAYESFAKFKIDSKYMGGATNAKIMAVFDNLWYMSSWLIAGSAAGDFTALNTDLEAALTTAVASGGAFYDYASTDINSGGTAHSGLFDELATKECNTVYGTFNGLINAVKARKDIQSATGLGVADYNKVLKVFDWIAAIGKGLGPTNTAGKQVLCLGESTNISMVLRDLRDYVANGDGIDYGSGASYPILESLYAYLMSNVDYLTMILDYYGISVTLV